ncbi:MAG: hypothetical protein OEY59_11285 [Deltaproteobacteria bacterium]|nr:hypothetical protein [Deltaproteobacteria bacterium]
MGKKQNRQRIWLWTFIFLAITFYLGGQVYAQRKDLVKKPAANDIAKQIKYLEQIGAGLEQIIYEVEKKSEALEERIISLEQVQIDKGVDSRITQLEEKANEPMSDANIIKERLKWHDQQFAFNSNELNYKLNLLWGFLIAAVLLFLITFIIGMLASVIIARNYLEKYVDSNIDTKISSKMGEALSKLHKDYEILKFDYDKVISDYRNFQIQRDMIEKQLDLVKEKSQKAPKNIKGDKDLKN